MPLTLNLFGWVGLRAVAGFASAVVFVVAVNTLLERLPERVGWGFGGVGAGIALSAVLVLALPTAGWRAAWVAASISAQRRYFGPFLASECRWSLRPDW